MVKLARNKEEMVPDKVPKLTRQSDEPIAKKKKWINKQRVMVLCTRGINHRDRHLMEDLRKLMPHSKHEAKMERSKTLSIINEMSEMKNCNKAVLFEGRTKRDLYMWMANVPNGPSCKFLVENVYTMQELKLTGNCLRGSRPLLSFDSQFDQKPHLQLIKTLLGQVFGVPRNHPKSQPFFDRVYTFSYLDNRIWLRHFQILSEDGALNEIGPRLVLNPVKIFNGSFTGACLWENDRYVSPSSRRQLIKKAHSLRYEHKVEQKAHSEATRPENAYTLTHLNDIFDKDALEKAKELHGKEHVQQTVQEETKEAKKPKTSKSVRKPKTVTKSVVAKKLSKTAKVAKKGVKKVKRNVSKN